MKLCTVSAWRQIVIRCVAGDNEDVTNACVYLMDVCVCVCVCVYVHTLCREVAKNMTG